MVVYWIMNNELISFKIMQSLLLVYDINNGLCIITETRKLELY